MFDWSYNYHTNNVYQQVAPIEIYVEKNPDHPPLTPTTTLFAVNKQPYIHLCLYPCWYCFTD